MRRGRDASALGIAAILVVTTGCSSTGDDGDAGESVASAVVPSIEVPAERLSPFCEAMIGLNDQLVTDPPDDEGALILDTYLGILDEVPAAIDQDFRAVIALLQGNDPPPTIATIATAISTSVPEATEDFDAEGRLLPGESPSERVNEYVLFTCRDSVNNPGPPATEPLEDVVPDDEE